MPAAPSILRRRRGAPLLLVLACAVLATAVATHAQTRIHRSLTVEDGLVQSQVNVVHEDHDGYLWLGTFGGVSRWDGRTFHNLDTRNGLPGVDIRVFTEASGNRLLIGTHEGGIAVYDRDAGGRIDTVDTEDGLASNSVRAIRTLPNGTLWVATSAGVTVFGSDRFGAPVDTLLKGLSVSAIAVRVGGDHLVSTFRDGVFRIDGNDATPVYRDALPDRIVRFVYFTRDGAAWISVHRHGLWVARNGNVSPFAHNDEFGGVDVKSMLEASDGTVYFSTLGRGVAAFQDDRITWLDPAAGLSSDISWGATEGASGVIYASTWGGCDFYFPGRATTIAPRHDLPHPVVTAIAEGDGRTYIGTAGGGVAVWRGGRVERVISTEAGLADDRVWSLLVRSDGRVYAGTSAGVSVIDGTRAETLYGEGDIWRGRVYAMHESRDGRVYFATYAGVMVEANGVVTPAWDEPNLERSTVLCIYEAGGGALFFGTHAGVTVLDGNEVRYMRGAIAGERVFSIARATDGTMLYGTNAGGLYAGADSVVLSTRDGLTDNTVYGIVVADSAWYLTGHRGVNIVTPHDGYRVRSFRHLDGLASDECVQGALAVDRRGRLWIGTIKGVTVYDPARDAPHRVPPEVHITRVRLYDAELARTRFETGDAFEYDQNYFRFEFIGTNPHAPEDVRYRYRLTGIDPDWVESSEPRVQYTALDPGDYRFEVRASGDGVAWSPPAALSFAIAPPFWETWWFITLAVVVVGGTLALVIANRVRHALAIERLRGRIASDLHDDIGAGLTEISIMSEVARQSLSGEHDQSRTRESLDGIASTSRALVASMSDIVWLVNPTRDTLHDLVTRLGDSFKETLDAAGIGLELSGVERLREVRMGMDERRHLYLLLKEAVNNAVKHADATAISVGVAVEDNRVSVTVSDDGRGFDATAARSGNGLAGMEERAAAIGGRLEIRSTREGTRVRFVGR